ncbi:hypothetical protein BpHYR1_030203 [Brachionus plicatilis]|uniref:Uncharacterized protein n=1 Tax=Brachionus plicatilis TaxID=10195 RepID=A0A3M7RN40_BRAPC|nr:hypothetical protein BpHYR1_030203 [Brachionus plicatilis]
MEPISAKLQIELIKKKNNIARFMKYLLKKRINLLEKRTKLALQTRSYVNKKGLLRIFYTSFICTIGSSSDYNRMLSQKRNNFQILTIIPDVCKIF